MKKIVAGIVLVMAGIVGVSTAQAAAPRSACNLPTKEFVHQAEATGWLTKELTGRAKSIALQNINSTPPVTHIRPGHLFVAAMKEADDHPAMGMLIFADNDCITSIAGPTPLGGLLQFLAGQVPEQQDQQDQQSME